MAHVPNRKSVTALSAVGQWLRERDLVIPFNHPRRKERTRDNGSVCSHLCLDGSLGGFVDLGDSAQLHTEFYKQLADEIRTTGCCFAFSEQRTFPVFPFHCDEDLEVPLPTAFWTVPTPDELEHPLLRDQLAHDFPAIYANRGQTEAHRAEWDEWMAAQKTFARQRVAVWVQSVRDCYPQRALKLQELLHREGAAHAPQRFSATSSALTAAEAALADRFLCVATWGQPGKRLARHTAGGDGTNGADTTRMLWKLGCHIHFPNVLCDSATAASIARWAAERLEQVFGPPASGAPWYPNVVDCEVYTSNGLRLPMNYKTVGCPACARLKDGDRSRTDEGPARLRPPTLGAHVPTASSAVTTRGQRVSVCKNPGCVGCMVFHPGAHGLLVVLEGHSGLHPQYRTADFATLRRRYDTRSPGSSHAYGGAFPPHSDGVVVAVHQTFVERLRRQPHLLLQYCSVRALRKGPAARAPRVLGGFAVPVAMPAQAVRDVETFVRERDAEARAGRKRRKAPATTTPAAVATSLRRLASVGKDDGGAGAPARANYTNLDLTTHAALVDELESSLRDYPVQIRAATALEMRLHTTSPPLLAEDDLAYLKEYARFKEMDSRGGGGEEAVVERTLSVPLYRDVRVARVEAPQGAAAVQCRCVYVTGPFSSWCENRQARHLCNFGELVFIVKPSGVFQRCRCRSKSAAGRLYRMSCRTWGEAGNQRFNSGGVPLTPRLRMLCEWDTESALNPILDGFS